MFKYRNRTVVLVFWSAIHELGHNLCFGHKHIWANRAMGMVANLPIVLPMAIMYRQVQ